MNKRIPLGKGDKKRLFGIGGGLLAILVCGVIVPCAALVGGVWYLSTHPQVLQALGL